MSKQLIKDTLGWGVALWSIGYVLGIILFIISPYSLIGWFIMPVGVVVLLWVLLKKIKSESLKYYLTLSISWTIIAVIFDYIFLVRLFKPQDGYYKIDVYIYYVLVFVLPLSVGRLKSMGSRLSRPGSFLHGIHNIYKINKN